MFNLVIQTTGVPVYYFVFGAKLVVVNSWWIAQVTHLLIRLERVLCLFHNVPVETRYLESILQCNAW
jgi:hypothetical protein